MKHLSTLTAIILLSISLHAQIGLMVGANNGSVTNGRGTYYGERQTGIAAGAYAQIKWLDLEATYTQKGTQWCLGGDAGFANYNGNFYYVQLAAVPTIKTGDFRVGLGAYGAYLLGPNTLTNVFDERRLAWSYGRNQPNDYTNMWDWGVKAITSWDLHGAVLQVSAEQSTNRLVNKSAAPYEYNPAHTKLWDAQAKLFSLQAALKIPLK